MEPAREGDAQFSIRVAEAIEERRQGIQADELPRLRELFRLLHASVQGLHQILIRKGLVQEDPYKSEQRISDITPPVDDSYLESEQERTIGIRLDAYDNTLVFLNNSFEFRLEALGFRELGKLSAVAQYIRWNAFTSHSEKPTTRALADLLHRARGGQDSLAAGVISDSLEQLRKNLEAILDHIQAISVLKREEYKQVLREQVLPSIAGPPSLDEIRVKHKALSLPGKLIEELAEEVLAETIGDRRDERRREVLDRLRPAKRMDRKARPKETLRDALVSAIRGLAAASRALDTISEHFCVNIEVLRSGKRSFSQRFREWIDRMTNREPQKTSYQIEYLDEATGAQHTQVVVFDDFVDLMGKKARLYGSFLARSGDPWARLQAASDEQLYKFVEKELGECHRIHRRAAALDEVLKRGVDTEERRKMKGVKIELTSLKNAIATAGRLKHEYVARKGELEQMKRLGIEL